MFQDGPERWLTFTPALIRENKLNAISADHSSKQDTDTEALGNIYQSKKARIAQPALLHNSITGVSLITSSWGNFNSFCFNSRDFTFSWTLSSKFFATFPHGTCLLSLSLRYLAFDEVYHRLKAALSSNPTPSYIDISSNSIRTGLTPSLDYGPVYRNLGLLSLLIECNYTLQFTAA